MPALLTPDGSNGCLPPTFPARHRGGRRQIFKARIGSPLLFDLHEVVFFSHLIGGSTVRSPALYPYSFTGTEALNASRVTRHAPDDDQHCRNRTGESNHNGDLLLHSSALTTQYPTDRENSASSPAIAAEEHSHRTCDSISTATTASAGSLLP